MSHLFHGINKRRDNQTIYLARETAMKFSPGSTTKNSNTIHETRYWLREITGMLTTIPTRRAYCVHAVHCC